MNLITRFTIDACLEFYSYHSDVDRLIGSGKLGHRKTYR
jgi:hypothetical protein